MSKLKIQIINEVLKNIETLSQITIRKKDGEVISVVDFYELKGMLEKMCGETPIDNQTLFLFETFWKKYPRKINKKNALKIWERLKVDQSLYLIIDKALDVQMETEQWKNPQYIPHPATWLNGERWNDEVEVKTLPNNKYQGL